MKIFTVEARLDFVPFHKYYSYFGILTLQDNHNICTLSVNIQLISTHHRLVFLLFFLNFVHEFRVMVINSTSDNISVYHGGHFY